MKILIINSLYSPFAVGGAEVSVKILAEELVNKGHEVIVAATRPSCFENVKTINQVKVYYLKLKNLYWPYSKECNPYLRLIWIGLDLINPFMALQLKQIIKVEKPNIIHTNNLSGFSVLAWMVARKNNIPLIHTLRDYYLLCHLTTMFRKGKNCKKQCLHCQIFSKIKKNLSNLPNSVVGISDFILKHHLNQGYFSKVPNKNVIYNPCDRFALSSHKLNDKNIHFGFLGRITKAKGIERLLESILEVNYENLILHIGGKGNPEYINYLKKAFPINAIYHGYVEKSEFLNMVDFLVIPSVWNEPSGRIILEAYSYGVPVIGSNTGGIPEIIENGKTGFIFDYDKKMDLVDKLKICFQQREELKNKMKPNCIEKSKKYSPEICADNYLNAYCQIIN